MFNLIPVSLLIGALGGILYIVSGHLSEFNDNEEEKKDVLEFNLKSRIAQYINRLPLDNIKIQSLSLTKKTLHRFRVALLKTDNHLIKLISKISQRDNAMRVKTNENDNIPDFWEKVAKPEEQTAAPETPLHQVERASRLVSESERAPFEGGEVKIVSLREMSRRDNFAVQDELPKKFLDPVRSQSPKATTDVISHRTSNGIDIRPAKISSEISETKLVKKSLKKKKSSK